MNFNKDSNVLNKNEINHKSFLNHKPFTKTQGETEIKSSGCPNCFFEKKKKEKTVLPERYETSDAEKSSKTTTNSTSSTDSGVFSSDNENIPPPLIKSFHLNSFEKNTTGHCYKQFHKNNKNRDNNVNNNESNYCKNNNKNNFINFIKDIDHDDVNNDSIISKNFDIKFKVVESRKEDSRYQHKTPNTSESKNEENISQQRNLRTLTATQTPTPTSTSTKSKEQNGKPLLKHNEVNQQQHFSTTSSLSMASTANSYDYNPPSNMHHCKGSPVVSIRSISSTIITTDSDSDINSDTENYVIKKLGTQVTYSSTDPAIQNINQSHTILNEMVIVNSTQAPLWPLEPLAVIGDRIGTAQALGPVPFISDVAKRPQIGSVALSNSSDVTFGDKHFYEGPVTIQQFLIDSRDKCKETNGKENPTFANENAESSINNDKDLNSDAEKLSNVYEYILNRKKMVISGVLAFTALLIMAIIWGSKVLNERESKLVIGNNEESRNIIPIISTIGQDNVGGGYVFRMVPRDGWLAQPPVNPWVKLNLPIKRVIVIPTRTSECETQAACTYTVRITQTYNIESQQQDDIIYNFLIGGDGNIYEGRGWDNRGSAVKGFNDDSISFAFIGSFRKQPPSYKQLNVTELLLKEGVRLKKLSSNYKIVGANKLDATSVVTSADALYKSFKNWPRWSDE